MISPSRDITYCLDFHFKAFLTLFENPYLPSLYCSFRIRRLCDHLGPSGLDDLCEVEQEEVTAGGEDPGRGHGAERITGAEEENIEKHE